MGKDPRAIFDELAHVTVSSRWMRLGEGLVALVDEIRERLEPLEGLAEILADVEEADEGE